MFDLIITPVTNKFLVIMKLYDQVKRQVSETKDETITIINNGSTDGLHQRSFHTHNKIHYLGSKHKTYDNILTNHAMLRKNPSYDINTHIVLLQPNTEIPKNYFDYVKSAIKSNPDADVIFGRVDHKVKNKISKDPRVKKWQDFEQKRNSGALLKNFPPVREKSLKTDEKATEPTISAIKEEKKTKKQSPEQNVSADFSSRSEEPSVARLTTGWGSISEKRASAKIGSQEASGDEKCQAIFSDKICQCKMCIQKDTDNKGHLKDFSVKSFNSKKVNSSAVTNNVSDSNDTQKNEQYNKMSHAVVNEAPDDERINKNGLSIFNVSKFYHPNNIILKKDTIFKMGLLDIYYSFNQATELLIHKLIYLQNGLVIYEDSFPVVQTGKVRKHKSNNEAINNIINWNFVYKDYVDKNVYKVYSTRDDVEPISIEGQPFGARAIKALIILGSQHNEELVKLTEQQMSIGDKLVVTELPDNCSKKLQEIIASNSVEQYEIVIIVNPNSKFKYSHFVDDFKRYSCQMDYEGVLVSNRDFDVREITPSLAVESDVSACFNDWMVFAPAVREATSLSEFFQKCSAQIDATGRGLVSAFLPKPISSVPIMHSEVGEGGEIIKSAAVKHKSSWYDWME